VPLGLIIDRTTELKRLEREIEKLRHDLDKSEKKLQNKSFLTKAPPQIVNKEQSRVQNIRHSIAELEDQYRRVENL
jgi:valyl-tRNA synthetase